MLNVEQIAAQFGVDPFAMKSLMAYLRARIEAFGVERFAALPEVERSRLMSAGAKAWLAASADYLRSLQADPERKAALSEAVWRQSRQLVARRAGYAFAQLGLPCQPATCSQMVALERTQESPEEGAELRQAWCEGYASFLTPTTPTHLH